MGPGFVRDLESGPGFVHRSLYRVQYTCHVIHDCTSLSKSNARSPEFVSSVRVPAVVSPHHSHANIKLLMADEKAPEVAMEEPVEVETREADATEVETKEVDVATEDAPAAPADLLAAPTTFSFSRAATWRADDDDSAP